MIAVQWLRLAFPVIAASTALALAPALNETAAADRAPRWGQPGKDVIWLPTPDDMVARMLDLAQLAAGERLVDLGSGDGRIAIAAAKRGALAKGIEYDAEMVAHSRRLAAQARVDVDLVEGEWKVVIGSHPGPTLRIEQRFQKLEGRVVWGERGSPLRDAAIRGPVVIFTATDAAGLLHRFEGVADHGGPMIGVVTPANGGAPRLFVATRS